ncbi:MAG: hypothetical protein J1E16_06425 [Muribaculaceae bacterium]|nr:hypothetical protein [Muribaculaceae bacterium]
MAKGKSQQEKERFIKENLHLVPKKSEKDFPNWDVDKQYTKILLYVSKSKKLNVNSIVKSITDKNPSQSDVEKIITQLQDWVNSSTTRRIEEIKKEQERLAKELQKLEGK